MHLPVPLQASSACKEQAVRCKAEKGDEERQCAGQRRCQEYARSEEHTSELQSLMRISYAVFCLKKKNIKEKTHNMCALEYTQTKRNNEVEKITTIISISQ